MLSLHFFRFFSVSAFIHVAPSQTGFGGIVPPCFARIGAGVRHSFPTILVRYPFRQIYHSDSL